MEEEAPAYERQISDSVAAYYERLMQKYGTDYAVRVSLSSCAGLCASDSIVSLGAELFLLILDHLAFLGDGKRSQAEHPSNHKAEIAEGMRAPLCTERAAG